MKPELKKLYFNYSRAAIVWGCQNILNLKRGTTILLPEYVCRVVPDSLQASGYQVDYYSQSNYLKTDFESIEQKSKGAAALLFVHYFGYPAEFEKFRKIASSKNLPLIEDAAHVGGDQIGGRTIGADVEFSVQSLWKTLPIKKGSLLKTSMQASAPDLPIAPSDGPNFREEIKSVLLSSRIARELAWTRRYSNLVHHRPERSVAPHILSKGFIQKVDALQAQSNSSDRLRIDSQWRSWISKKGLQPLFEQSSSASPWSTPVLVKNQIDRDNLLKDLYLNGYLSATWPQLTEYSLNISHNKDLWSRLITLPIDPNNRSLMEKINEL